MRSQSFCRILWGVWSLISFCLSWVRTSRFAVSGLPNQAWLFLANVGYHMALKYEEST